MQNNPSLKTVAIVASAMAVALSMTSTQALAGKNSMEKCYGVAKAGKNDCAAAGNNSCAGTSTKDGDPKAWILVPSGTCDKIVGGSTEPRES
ncbi:MAG: DUF2282 domain-containing protein [Alphaproteobacteria bacterium]|nr:MAG: DUF2282 domain-containing protein [Alphaproteobacteria bacterium]